MTNWSKRWLAYRVRILPKQLEAARRKVAALEREAARLGMLDLLDPSKETEQ